MDQTESQNDIVVGTVQQSFEVRTTTNNSLFVPQFAQRNVPCFVVSEDELEQIGRMETRSSVYIALSALAFGGAISVKISEAFTTDLSARAQAFFDLALPGFLVLGVVFGALAAMEMVWKASSITRIKTQSMHRQV